MFVVWCGKGRQLTIAPDKSFEGPTTSTHAYISQNTHPQTTQHKQAHAPEYLQWLNELLMSSSNTSTSSLAPIPFPRTTPFRPPPSAAAAAEGDGEGTSASGGFVVRPDALVEARRAAGAVLHAVDQVVSSE